jgi:hypothetical protein
MQILFHVQYTKEELILIISNQLPGDQGLGMKRDYVSLVLSVFYSVARYGQPIWLVIDE